MFISVYISKNIQSTLNLLFFVYNKYTISILVFVNVHFYPVGCKDGSKHVLDEAL